MYHFEFSTKMRTLMSFLFEILGKTGSHSVESTVVTFAKKHLGSLMSSLKRVDARLAAGFLNFLKYLVIFHDFFLTRISSSVGSWRFEFLLSKFFSPYFKKSSFFNSKLFEDVRSLYMYFFHESSRQFFSSTPF